LSGFAGTIRAIFLKDLLSEIRTKQLLPTMIMLGLLIGWIFRIASESAPYPAVLACAVLLVSLLFSAILACEKSFALEQHNDCMCSLLLCPADPGTIYLAKLLVNIVWLCLFELVTVPVVFVLFKAAPTGAWVRLVAVLLLCNIGVCSLGTLLGAVVQQTQGSGSLLSVLAMAALCPMMLPATSALLYLLNTGTQQTDNLGLLGMVGGFGSALGYMIAFDAIFVTLCWLLFGFVVRE